MFFTPELLSKRDSGFGLLWLAATLGSKSAFKKLPKRSVLTADITQLCDLISEPAEPLALRLSSNLMFGVVRVYKVKQEILMSDVTNCVTSLKKVVQDLRASGAVDGQLQMPNSVARISALTIVPNPRAAYALDYDAFVANWDEYLNIGETTADSEPPFEEDGEYDPETRAKRQKRNAKAASQIETVRKETHTLDEHHDHLLSASFELSFSQAGPAAGDPSSSHAEAAFENFFPFSDGLDVGDGLGDDLARELGWGTSPVKSARSNRNMMVDPPELNFEDANNLDVDFNFGAGDILMLDEAPIVDNYQMESGTPRSHQTPRHGRNLRKENALPPSRLGSIISRAPSPSTSFSRLLLSQDLEHPQPLKDITTEEQNRLNQGEPRKKLKRTRLLLDARTELTDSELRIARAKYLESQILLRREINNKKSEKDSGRIIEGLIWGVPKGIEAKSLIDFWQENFKVQVEARSGVLRIHRENVGPPHKRRKTSAREEDIVAIGCEDYISHADMNVDIGMDFGAENPYTVEASDAQLEEPGQARRVSRSASILGASNLAFDLGPRDAANGSQRSSLFPWDNAGASSSSGNVPFAQPGSDHLVDPVDVRLRSSSWSRQGSPLVLSQRGSVVAGGIGFSPINSGRGSQPFGEDFAFDVDNPVVPEDTQQDTQKSDFNLITLERNSYNFLEYAKMQYQTLPPHGQLTFETVVPRMTSTRHVAAAAFYHCLVLGTKNLIHLEQPEPFAPFKIAIV